MALAGRLYSYSIGPGRSRASYRRAHHLDLAGRCCKHPAGSAGKNNDLKGRLRPKVPISAVCQSRLAGGKLDMLAGSGRWENSLGSPRRKMFSSQKPVPIKSTELGSMGRLNHFTRRNPKSLADVRRHCHAVSLWQVAQRSPFK
jgi:hypothetical protein